MMLYIKQAGHHHTQQENNTSHGRSSIFLQMSLRTIVPHRLSCFQPPKDSDNLRTCSRTDHKRDQQWGNHTKIQHNQHLIFICFLFFILKIYITVQSPIPTTLNSNQYTSFRRIYQPSVLHFCQYRCKILLYADIVHR